ncbi:uncharacterized protein MELLADRAFT_102530 [Melampsora larici-populina 98AG31]|uniref:DNA 3'-5' helicase n=1 Tax=Melampsora larici-populina (strain 98AG31 / pathotype 3-4-7) TaxID=747676 RepID=F4R726_MELLP|nr:uncharacterized protein MELLADRAFT_102530 [Melampsora larici-populina 98AG31]EGG11581.1 hypothetical protein MELLADRAFT_102530 [Melampsora larici-populina 98AG31]
MLRRSQRISSYSTGQGVAKPRDEGITAKAKLKPAYNNVSKKASVNLRAVNLTGANCTNKTCDKILQGEFNFVHVSPEIALSSDVFDRMWRNPSFQARLVLIVVDEAHMVYEWGMVASGEARRLACQARVQDAGVFRLSYGDLSRRILSAGKIPLLLMSATCTPQALNAITENLKLDPRDV